MTHAANDEAAMREALDRSDAPLSARRVAAPGTHGAAMNSPLASLAGAAAGVTGQKLAPAFFSKPGKRGRRHQVRAKQRAPVWKRAPANTRNHENMTSLYDYERVGKVGYVRIDRRDGICEAFLAGGKIILGEFDTLDAARHAVRQAVWWRSLPKGKKLVVLH